MLQSRLGLALFILLQNRWGWALLNERERAAILKANREVNATRADYTPEMYQGGANYDAPADPKRAFERMHLERFLREQKPVRVIEIGPGSGHLTRLIVEAPWTQVYIAYDVNTKFVEYILGKIPVRVSASFFTGDEIRMLWTADGMMDSVVLCSVVHHIPDRIRLFGELRVLLRNRARVFATDPTHYLSRLRKIVRKLKYLNAHFDEVQRGTFSTHAMCSLAEYQVIAKRTGFRIVRVEFADFPWWKKYWPFPERWISGQMMIELEAI